MKQRWHVIPINNQGWNTADLNPSTAFDWIKAFWIDKPAWKLSCITVTPLVIEIWLDECTRAEIVY